MMPTQPNPPKQIREPMCPHCKARPCRIAVMFTSFDRASHAAVFFCGKCSIILSVSPLIQPNPPRMLDSPLILLPK
jgi:hypothetical protein